MKTDKLSKKTSKTTTKASTASPAPKPAATSVPAVAKPVVTTTPVLAIAPDDAVTRATTVTPPAAGAPAAPVAAPHREITTELIAVRAYTLWEQQGRPQGNDLQNWLVAEKQLKQEQSFTA